MINRYDGAAGVAEQQWGIPAATNIGRFQYTGQAWIAEVGLYYYKARFYSPTLGRFMQTDPVGYKDDANLYAYVGNDPVNKGDPTGLACSTGTIIPNHDAIGCGTLGLKSQDSGIPTSEKERKALKSGDLDAYWQSRCDREDPIGCLGVDYGKKPPPGMAYYSYRQLYLALLKKHSGSMRVINVPLAAKQAARRELATIRVELAQAHADATDRDNQGIPNLLSALQISQYHWTIFNSHGLSDRDFGGTQVTGTRADLVYSSIWCSGCDSSF